MLLGRASQRCRRLKIFGNEKGFYTWGSWGYSSTVGFMGYASISKDKSYCVRKYGIQGRGNVIASKCWGGKVLKCWGKEVTEHPRKTQSSAEHSTSMKAPGKALGCLRVFLYNTVLLKNDVCAAHCRYQFHWFTTLLLHVLSFRLVVKTSAEWEVESLCFIWEDVQKNWVCTYIYALGCQLCMKIPMW